MPWNDGDRYHNELWFDRQDQAVVAAVSASHINLLWDGRTNGQGLREKRKVRGRTSAGDANEWKYKIIWHMSQELHTGTAVSEVTSTALKKGLYADDGLKHHDIKSSN